MQTTVNLPDSLYQKSEALAASRGATGATWNSSSSKPSRRKFKATSGRARPAPTVIVKWSCRSSAPGDRGRWTCQISTLMTYLPDVNVWIALAAERHTHHRTARHWFSNLHEENSHSAALANWAFCGC
jgi:hypothetical protein